MLCRHDGREFRLLEDREPGAFVEVELNGQRTASITIPASQVEDRQTGAARVHAGRSRLKVFAHKYVSDPDRVLIFNGLITSPRAFDDRVVLPAVDQSIRLFHASPAPLDAVGEGSIRIINEEASLGLWKMIYRSNKRVIELQQSTHPDAPGIGIRKGTLADTGITRQLVLPDGPVCWDTLTEEVARRNSPDFELEPLDTEGEKDDGEGAGEIHAKFNTYYPRQGTNRASGLNSVILEDRLNSRIEHEPSATDPGICNRFIAVGRSWGGSIAPVYVAENKSSIETFGVWQEIDGSIGIVDLNRLQRYAEGQVAARSRVTQHFDVRPAVEAGGQARGWQRDANDIPFIDNDTFQVPPTFLPGDAGDYWIGDTVQLRSRRFYMGVERLGQIDGEFEARITRGRFTELDAAANVGVELETVVDDNAGDVSGYRSEIFTGEEFTGV